MVDRLKAYADAAKGPIVLNFIHVQDLSAAEEVEAAQAAAAAEAAAAPRMRRTGTEDETASDFEPTRPFDLPADDAAPRKR